MMLVHWGNTNSKHKNSTTAYWGDNWDEISQERRGDHPCFDPSKDLVVPAWKVPDPHSMRVNYWERYICCLMVLGQSLKTQSLTLVFFFLSLGLGKRGKHCFTSMGILDLLMKREGQKIRKSLLKR